MDQLILLSCTNVYILSATILIVYGFHTHITYTCTVTIITTTIIIAFHAIVSDVLQQLLL